MAFVRIAGLVDELEADSGRRVVLGQRGAPDVPVRCVAVTAPGDDPVMPDEIPAAIARQSAAMLNGQTFMMGHGGHTRIPGPRFTVPHVDLTALAFVEELLVDGAA